MNNPKTAIAQIEYKTYSQKAPHGVKARHATRTYFDKRTGRRVFNLTTPDAITEEKRGRAERLIGELNEPAGGRLSKWPQIVANVTWGPSKAGQCDRKQRTRLLILRANLGCEALFHSITTLSFTPHLMQTKMAFAVYDAAQLGQFYANRAVGKYNAAMGYTEATDNKYSLKHAARIQK